MSNPSEHAMTAARIIDPGRASGWHISAGTVIQLYAVDPAVAEAVREYREALNQTRNALEVIARTAHIDAYLHKNDPKAIGQVHTALKAARSLLQREGGGDA